MIDTSGARDDMRAAEQYIEQFEKTLGQWQLLDFAMNYVNSARRKDPNATLHVKLGPGEVGLKTLNYMEGHVLFLQAERISEDYTPKSLLPEAIRLLRRRPLPRRCYSVVYPCIGLHLQ
jgi:hypothetical protein